MKQGKMPFTVLKSYFEGEIFEVVAVDAKFQLESNKVSVNFDGSVLVGMSGEPYTFTSLQNAEYWLESNFIRSAQKDNTAQISLDRLIAKQAKEPNDALAAEIATIQAKNGGDWFEWSELFIEGGDANG